MILFADTFFAFHLPLLFSFCLLSFSTDVIIINAIYLFIHFCLYTSEIDLSVRMGTRRRQWRKSDKKMMEGEKVRNKQRTLRMWHKKTKENETNLIYFSLSHIFLLIFLLVAVLALSEPRNNESWDIYTIFGVGSSLQPRGMW